MELTKSTIEDVGIVCRSCREPAKYCDVCTEDFYPEAVVYCEADSQYDSTHYCEGCAEDMEK